MSVAITLIALFQSTPRFVGEGNPVLRIDAPGQWCFNPPPALSARGTRATAKLYRGGRVSIHPPLCRRGELVGRRLILTSEVFQSTPRFVGEGNSSETF